MFFFGRVVGNFDVLSLYTEHESVFCPDPCMRPAVKRETKKGDRMNRSECSLEQGEKLSSKVYKFVFSFQSSSVISKPQKLSQFLGIEASVPWIKV